MFYRGLYFGCLNLKVWPEWWHLSAFFVASARPVLSVCLNTALEGKKDLIPHVLVLTQGIWSEVSSEMSAPWPLRVSQSISLPGHPTWGAELKIGQGLGCLLLRGDGMSRERHWLLSVLPGAAQPCESLFVRTWKDKHTKSKGKLWCFENYMVNGDEDMEGDSGILARQYKIKNVCVLLRVRISCRNKGQIVSRCFFLNL